MTAQVDVTRHHRPRVLVVDDAPVNRLVLSEALGEDYEVLLADDGPGAVRLAGGEARPDLILLDVNMPGMDGYAVCEQLKESTRTRDIPVIFVTARNEPDDEVRGFTAGAADYITWPLQLPVVQARVRTQLSCSGLIQRLDAQNRVLAERLAALADVGGEVPARLYLRALEHTRDAVMITRADSTIVAVNHAFAALTGYPESEALGRTPRLLRSGRHPPAFYKELYATLAARGRWSGELINRRRDGSLFPAVMTIAAVHDRDGELGHYVSAFSDVTMIRQVQERMDYLTWHDALTGLPNRLLLTDRLRQTLKLGQCDTRVAVAMVLDIERFGALNEALGAQVADAVLGVVASRLRRQLCTGDTLARLDGDEFAVVLAGVYDSRESAAHHARLVAGQLGAAVAEPLEIAGSVLRLGLGIGITLFPKYENDEAGEVLRRAQTARHRAGDPETGGQSIVFFDERMGESVEHRFRLEQELHHAINAGELRVYLQSQVDQDGRITGAEALLRWQHPQRGLVPPGEFIPIAECTELIVQLDRWVLGEVVALLARSAGCRPAPTLSVNISPRMFASPGFVDELRTLLAPHPDSARRLVIELTEGVLVHDPEVVAERMAALGALGVRFSIDDFGTGYSSLTYLKRLPLHELKIDRSFILEAPHDADDAALVGLIVSVAGHLRLEVVAEGVETAVHADWLRSHPGVRRQGYLYGRPVPAGDWFGDYASGCDA